MDKRLNEVLAGRPDNYLLPFFWQDSDHRERLAEQIAVIHSSGARAFCVESRTHEDFCGETWWQDMDLILAEAQKRGMQVWLLDDKHFPTGYANGAMAQHPELRKWFLRERHVDVMGPLTGCTLLLEDTDDELLGVTAFRRSGEGEEITGAPVDLTDAVRGRWAGWDVPAGCWRVFFLYRSRRGGAHGQDRYIDLLRSDSVRVLIDAVYEPHHRRYGELFGTTFAGFFSDEPSLGNDLTGQWTVDYGMYDRRLGMPGLSLPWNNNVSVLLAEQQISVSQLPALWYPSPDAPRIRLAYMEAVTGLYRDCFCRQLGDWCREHGAAYIGHIIEDMNAHARLGCSAGHYFRALAGQDMAGIDIVLHQVMPGFAHYRSAASAAGGVADPAFFHYVLGKLAASLAHITPRMQGRAMCEVFGAYGWAEGAPMMKWLMDFLLVRGINHFVPHAFTPSFPSPDCPPHFDAWGNDPQFGGFTALMDYVNKAAHLLSGGVHQADVALLYHAEGEWMAERDEAMLVQVPAKALYDDHIDYDILPIDAICDRAHVTADGDLQIEAECYRCLVIPTAPRWPDRLLTALTRLQRQNARIIFVGEQPEGAQGLGEAVPLAGLIDFLRAQGFASVSASDDPLLRIYHVRRGETAVFLLFNESVTDAVDTAVQLPVQGDVLRLNLLQDAAYRDDIGTCGLTVRLQPYESEIVVCGDLPEDLVQYPLRQEWTARQPLDGLRWAIELCPSDASAPAVPCTDTALFNVTAPDRYPDFSGTIHYSTIITVENAAAACRLDLGTVGQTCRLCVNGVDMGARICPPYAYDLTGRLQMGENHLEIEVCNTLAHRLKDDFSLWVPLPPSGLLGPLTLCSTTKR